MFSLSLQLLLLRLVALLIAVAVHGAAQAAAAAALGDKGPRYDGRLTLNPMPHLDLLGGLGLLLYQLGWIRPLALDAAELGRPRRDLILIALAGLAANLVAAALLRLVQPLALLAPLEGLGGGLLAFLRTAVAMNLWLLAFNLVPLPPLTAAGIVTALVPSLREPFRRAARPVAIGLALLVVSGLASRALAPVTRTLTSLIDRL